MALTLAFRAALPIEDWNAQLSRATGMAGAFTATADDLSTMYYNPAGLGFQAEKGKLKLLDGIPPDAGGPEAATTPAETPPGEK